MSAPEQMENYRNIIVIGASAGGISTLSQLMNYLDPDIDATLLAVLHLAQRSSAENIVEYFNKNTNISCEVAENGKQMKRGRLYLAPENLHTFVKDGAISVNQGPREHRFRPSIDVLFRSVAVNYGNRTIGIILTGLLDDGTAGMVAIKRCGGICIVQEPSEAMYYQMPQNVVDRVAVDYKLPLSEIGKALKEIQSNPLPPEVRIPEEIKIESEITEKLMSSIDQLKTIADHSNFTCPDCGGRLWEIKNDPTHRYRCQTGHVYGEKVLYELQGMHVEESLWVCIRMLEERRNLLESLLRHDENNGIPGILSEQKEAAREIEEHIRTLKALLKNLVENQNKPKQE